MCASATRARSPGGSAAAHQNNAAGERSEPAASVEHRLLQLFVGWRHHPRNASALCWLVDAHGWRDECSAVAVHFDFNGTARIDRESRLVQRLCRAAEHDASVVPARCAGDARRTGLLNFCTYNLIDVARTSWSSRIHDHRERPALPRSRRVNDQSDSEERRISCARQAAHAERRIRHVCHRGRECRRKRSRHCHWLHGSTCHAGYERETGDNDLHGYSCLVLAAT